MEGEELLDSGDPWLPRPVRLGALVLAGLAVAALIVAKTWPHSSTHTPASTLPTWPWALNSCDQTIEVPIVSSTPEAERTGIRLLVGGNRLRVVDFDSGQVRTLPAVTLRPAENIVAFETASATYAVTGGGCEQQSPSRVLRLERDGRATAVASLGAGDGLLTDRDRAWIVRSPSDVAHRNASIAPLGGGAAVRLPDWTYPLAVVGGVVVARLEPNTVCPCSLVLLDATTGGRLADLGAAAAAVAVGAGRLAWTEGCDPAADKPCVLHARTIANAATRTYRLPRPAIGGVISPDGRRLALTLERPAKDPRFVSARLIPPSDVAVLDLGTGSLDIAPGIEMPAMSTPGLVFSADGRWLAIALDAGLNTRVLAWHAGLAHPYETEPVALPDWGPPPIASPP